MKNHQHINADGGSDEYFTPQHIVEAARRVMGRIDLDPASSAAANRRVLASKIFTLKTNGLKRPWGGAVWLNHPFGRETNGPWIKKLVQEWESGRVEQLCCITFAATSEKWFQPLIRQPQCFISPRTNYFLPDGTVKRGVTKGSVVTYFGHNKKQFDWEFSKLGTVKVVAALI